MANYEQLEKDICAVLCPVTTDETGKVTQLNTIYLASPLPDNESEYQKSFSKATAYIVCINSDYESPRATDIIIQEETISFEAILRARTRRGESGIFAIITDIKTKLVGLKLGIGFTKIRLIKQGYIDGAIQNDWNYSLSFSTTTKLIENQPEPVYPTFKKIDTNG